ncbi:MAG: SurA N-terminal domain-containing protein [Phenylobacterium sp.]
MLSAIRAFAKSWVAALLFGLLIVSFVIFGIGNRDTFRGRMTNAVIIAGDRQVTPNQFKRAFDGFKARLEQQAGQQITPEIAAANGLDQQVLQGMAANEAFSAYLTKIGLRPADQLIAAQIQKIPAFFDQVSGRFDKKAYLQRIASVDMSPTMFEAQMRDEITQSHAGSGIVAGLRAPRAYAALAALYATESRDIGYFVIEPTSVPQPPAPTDAQLTQFMQENAQRLMRPEFRVLTVVRFSPSQVAGALPVDEAEVKKRFDFKKDTLSTPETRTVVQVPAKDAAAATQIGQRLAKGEDPAAVAKAFGVEAITYDGKPQTAIPDRKIAAAAFTTPTGQVVAVKGDLGLAVIKVLSVTPGKAVTLDQVRPAIEAEIRKDAATEKVYALTQVYDDAHQGGASLAQAAQKAGVPAVTIGPLTKEGLDQQHQPVPGLSQKLVETAWSLPAGGESEVEEVGNGDYFAVRVEKVIPAAMPALAEVRPMLADAWTKREIANRMQARTDELAARVRKGESLDAVAASVGQAASHVPGIDKQNAKQNQTLSQDMLGKIFTSKPGDAFTAQFSRFAFVVGKLEAVHTADPTTLARLVEQIRPQMSSGYFREVGEAAQLAARQKVKVTIDANKAREAIGLEPIDPKAAAGKPAGKPGLAK